MKKPQGNVFVLSTHLVDEDDDVEANWEIPEYWNGAPNVFFTGLAILVRDLSSYWGKDLPRVIWTGRVVDLARA